MTDGAGMPTVERATAALVHVRLHGPGDVALHTGSYSTRELRDWAERVRGWEADGHEVFVLFDNDAEGNAVRNARSLRPLLQECPASTGPARPRHLSDRVTRTAATTAPPAPPRTDTGCVTVLVQ